MNKFDLDLSYYSAGPHWLSGPGKINREAIRKRNRDRFYAARKRRLDHTVGNSEQSKTENDSETSTQ